MYLFSNFKSYKVIFHLENYCNNNIQFHTIISINLINMKQVYTRHLYTSNINFFLDFYSLCLYFCNRKDYYVTLKHIIALHLSILYSLFYTNRHADVHAIRHTNKQQNSQTKRKKK